MTRRSVLSAAPLPAHALTPPRRRITLDVEAAPGEDAGRRVGVDLGANLGVGDDRGCAARRAGDGPVFRLAPEILRAPRRAPRDPRAAGR